VKVGWVGLGRLGLPCALVLAQYHKVYGYDVSQKPWQILRGELPPMQEEGIGELLRDTDHYIARADSVDHVVAAADIIFVAVQTPHSPEFGGEKPVPAGEGADFEYAFLVQACRDVARAAEKQFKRVTLVVVSTVLPGTTDRLIRPVLNDLVTLVYSPQFIAMGTTINDFRNPEFVICGADNLPEANRQLLSVFYPVHQAEKLFLTDIVTAESIKVYYNTFISMKIVWANHIMEMCHKTGADCDDVFDALSLATDRVISPRYMRGGMGDGGSCHPRDLIALSWLEDKLDMSSPLFWSLSNFREYQTEWLAGVVRGYAKVTGLPVTILGASYKPGSDLTAGSPALLLREYLKDLRPLHLDSNVAGYSSSSESAEPRVLVIATNHPEYVTHKFWPGSVVIDPFGNIPVQEGVTLIRVGRQ
jgi:UDPglucose 6-dehydrogenase